MDQLSHVSTKNTVHQFPISIICDNIRTPENVGMILRVAESFGVRTIFLNDSSPGLENRKVRKVSRSSYKNLEVVTYTNFDLLIKETMSNSTIIGIELTDESVPLSEFEFTLNKNIALVLGSERYGIQHIKDFDACVQINMYGKNSSMNVVNSLAITLYEVTNQLRKIDN